MILLISSSALWISFSMKYLGESRTKRPMRTDRATPGATTSSPTNLSTASSPSAPQASRMTSKIAIMETRPRQQQPRERQSTTWMIRRVVSQQMMESSRMGCEYVASPIMAMPKMPTGGLPGSSRQSSSRTQPMRAKMLAATVLNLRPLMQASQEKTRMPAPWKAPSAQGHWNCAKASSKQVAQMPASSQYSMQSRYSRIWYRPRGFRLPSSVLYSLIVLTLWLNCMCPVLFILVIVIIMYNTVQYCILYRMDIFPDSTEFPAPLYPLLTLLLTLTLYTGLSLYTLQPLTQSLFGLCSLQPPHSTLVYLLLINTPSLLLAGLSLVLHSSLLGFQVSCDIDHIQIVLLSAYVCYLEESRQTPIRGFLFVRDLGVAMGLLGALLGLGLDGRLRVEYGVVGLLLFVFYYGSLQVEEGLEDGVLRVLGIKQANTYNSQFLLTQPHKQANYLQLKNTIEQHKEQITQEISEHRDMLQKLYSSEDEKQILLNFAKIFLPYRCAIEIQEAQDIQADLAEIADQWVEGQEQGEDEQEGEEEGEEGEGKGNQSATCLMYNRTMTQDYVLQGQQQAVVESPCDKALKYLFYPLYFISTVQGRPRYFLDYLCVFLLCGLLWLLSCSCSYFTNVTEHRSYGILSLFVTAWLTLPTNKYYLRISEIKDFDFINIFLQSSILKSSLFSLLIIILSIANPSARLHGSLGLLIANILNILTYCIFGGFMIAHKFATLKTNMRFLGGLSIASFALRIVAEILCNTLL